MTQVLALAGSLRSSSVSRMALEIAIEGAQRAGGTVTAIHLGEPALPLFDAADSATSTAVLRFKTLAQKADALLLATPVYHDSMSGVLKNALDFLYDELEDKVVGLISVGGGRAGQGLALEHLRAVLREMNAMTLNRQVLLSGAADAFDENGVPRDTAMATRLRQLGQEVVLRAKLLRAAGEVDS
jgi:NAD(P)H-dependent FMN reductase